MKKNLLCLFTFFSLLVTCFGTQAQPCKQVIGYYPNWQWYDRAKLVNPATINYSKYTVINYAFFAPQDNGSILTTDAWADENLLLGQINWSTTPTSYYPNTSIVDRAHNAGVKIVPSIGGWTLSDKFPAIAADATKRANFAHACIQLCQQYNFDGIDIDWEYPGYTTHLGTTADKHNFTVFLQQIRDSLTTYGTAHNKTMLLTACVGASQSNMSNVEWGNIASILDYINLMSYDFFGSWDATANHNSPLYAPAQGDANFNLNSALQYLLTHYGVPANKINAGTAFYGRSAKTTGTPALFAPISGTDAATFSEDEGSPLYYNIAKRFNLFSQQWDSQAQVPYLLGLNGLNTFVSYDNAQSIALKAQYIVNNNLAGAIIWEITGDYLETAIGSGVIADTPLADTLNYVFCNGLPPITCNAPTALAATPATTSAVLNWASTGAASYQIQYKLATATNWTTTTSTTNSKTISGLTACTNYEYKVSSVCSNTLSSAYSTAFGFQTTGCTPVCNTPTALAATPATTSAVLNWASTAAASYQIQIRPVGSATWTTVTSVTNNYTLSALTACTNYEYKVSSVCSNTLSSAYSTAFGFQTTGCVNTCNAPTALAATPATTSAVLNWASTGAASYQIQYKLATATTWTTTTSTTNSKTISGLTACTNYQFRVKSVCSNTLSSANSTTFAFQTTGCVSLCNVPTALAATPANTSAVLNWASTGAASYQIQYKLATATTWTSTTSTTNTKTISGLTACTNYQFRVKSVCSNTLSSANSTTFAFQTTGCTPVCNAPTALAATPANTSTVLNWASTGAVSYQIQIRPTSSATWTTTTSTTNSKTISGLTACTNYEYKVASVCSNTLSSAYSTAFGFQTTGCTSTANCSAPTTFYFTNADYAPLGEIKLGQGRLSPVWGVPVDAYIPQNRLSWAISMVHAAHLFKNVAKTDKIPADFYWATAVKESFGGCDANIIAAPAGTAYPLSYQAAATGDGCFQIEGNSAYNELIAQYPQRFPAGQHSALIGGSNFETAALSKAYYDIFTVKYWEVNKGWNPSGFFNTATDPNAAVKLMAVAYNRGLWYGSLATVLNTDRTNALSATSISPYFADNSYGFDYQNALTKYVLVLGDKLNQVPIADQTNNSFGNYYNPQISWADVDSYITDIAPLYPDVNITNLRAAVQTTFNSINAGGAISFRYNLGTVLNTLILNLPADDPSANIALNYGCATGSGTSGTGGGTGGGTGTTAPNNYCSSYSLNATQEWIQNYSIGTINNNSGNNSGFGNFVDQSTNLTIGGGATISFAAGYTGTPVTEYWTVLIDYNRNGSFADAGETVISTTTTNNSTFTQAITVPATASVGYARMRVQLKRGAAATECDIYSGGEVEDYLVNLTTTSGKNSNFVGIDATLYPNPVTDVLTITTNLPTNAHNTLTLTDVYGKAIRSIDVDTNNTGSYTTNFEGLDNLPSGVYFVVISSNNSIVKTLKWLKD